MKFAIPIAALLSFLTGCTQPLVTPNLPQSQHKISHAKDWRGLAERTIADALKRIKAAPPIDTGGHSLQSKTIRPLGARPYYIHTSAADSPFSKTFTPLLQEELVRRGYTVSRSPRNALVLNYNVQTYYYGGEHRGRQPVEYASFWTTAALLGYAASTSTGAAAATGILMAPALDALYEAGKIVRGEAVLTTSIVTSNHIVHQASEAFYVLPPDLPFYWSRLPAGAPLEIEQMRPFVEPVRKLQVKAF